VFERFSPSARRAVLGSIDEAAAVGAVGVGPEHLLAAIAIQKGSIASSVLNDMGVTSEAVRNALEADDAEALGAIGISLDSVRRRIDHALGERAWNDAVIGLKLPFTEAGKAAITSAVHETRNLRQRVITPEHILLALVSEETMVGSLLKQLGVSPAHIQERVLAEVARHHAS
jgi:ATP-dependent Clp protease ATP-binding subunit ClpA